jgi:hypothetical protein
MNRELIEGVTAMVVVGAALVAVAAALLAGPPGAIGALSGALVSLISFRWIARAALRAGALFAGGRPGALWMLGLGLRHLTLFGLIAALLWSGVVSPVALVAGLSLLPPAVIVTAWRTLRTAV